MNAEEFLRQQFVALRAEILSSKQRCTQILFAGITLVIAAAFLSSLEAQFFANAAIPLILLVMILAFAAEQNAIVRAGMYIKLYIEPKANELTGWEHWLESHRGLRETDRFYFIGFVAMFLAFFAIACSLSLHQLNLLPTPFFAKSAAVTYALGLLWVLIVLWRHSSTLLSIGKPKSED